MVAVFLAAFLGMVVGFVGAFHFMTWWLTRRRRRPAADRSPCQHLRTVMFTPGVGDGLPWNQCQDCGAVRDIGSEDWTSPLVDQPQRRYHESAGFDGPMGGYEQYMFDRFEQPY